MSSRILRIHPERTGSNDTHGNAHELMRVALHEAGHAVAAHILGVQIGRVKVSPPTPLSTRTEMSCNEERQPFWAMPEVVDHEQKRFVDNYLMVACAGRAAEMVLYGEVDDTSAADDLRIVRETLRESPLNLVPPGHQDKVRDFIEAFIDRRCGAAAELLEPRQGLLYAVARLLIQRGTVEPLEIQALLNRMLIEDSFSS